jgi:PAS domain S-box-containing protein
MIGRMSGSPRTPGDSLGRALIAAMSEGVVVSVRQTGEVIVNAAAERILGLNPNQLRFGEPLPAGWLMLEADGETPMAEHPARTVARTGEAIHGLKGAVRHGDGTLTWVLMSAERYADPDGPYDGVVMTFADVTDERQRQQRELEDARLRSLDARMNDIEVIVALDGTIVQANDRALEAYGYTREELVGMSIRELRAAPTLEDINAQMQVAEAGGIRFETLHKRSDATVFPVEVSSRGFTVSGQRYLHSLVRDRTALEKAEADRRQLEARVADALRDRDLILSGSPVGIAKIRDRRLVWVNRRLAELLGYTASELTGHSTLALYLSEEDWEDMGEQAYSVLAVGDSFATERPLVRKDGTRFWARMSARAVNPGDEDGDSIWIVEDLSGAREAEERLAEAERQLQAMATALASGAPAESEALHAVAVPRRPLRSPAREAEGALAGGEHRFRQLYEHLDVAALALEVDRDERGRVTGLTLLEANPAGRLYFGPSYPFAVGRPASELFGDAAVRPLMTVAGRLLSGELETTEVAFATRNRWFAGIVFALDDRVLLAVASDHAVPQGREPGP